MPAGETPMGEPAPDSTPPCHDAPDVPEHEPLAPSPGDCVSACCAAQAAVDVPAPLPVADAVVLLAVVATDVLVVSAPEVAPLPEGPPLRPRARRHVELGRFLI